MKSHQLPVLTWGVLLALALFSCGGAHEPTTVAEELGSGNWGELVHPEWSKNATIYEVNVRQHTPEGTFAALQADLPRIKELGVDILWLMPIHPIGEVNRKGGTNQNNYLAKPGSGSLGSPYSVQDYTAVNPDMGTLEDLRSLVREAHRLGMRVILDWVANHTAFDSRWTREHPQFFLRDSLGNLQPPLGTDWWDVTQLDWEKGRENGLYMAMKDAMAFWLREADIDGYRCDVAEKVPVDFWEEVRVELEKIKPDVFMLAEAEVPEHHRRAFDMSYGWHAHHLFNEVARLEYPVDSLRSYLVRERERFPLGAYRMLFVTNHDENSWNGTTTERMGANAQVLTVLAGTWFGMPLIYSGQEAGETKRLSFFEKDSVDWGTYQDAELHRMLHQLVEKEEALWMGEAGAWPVEWPTDFPADVYAFSRKKGESEVRVALNFSDKPRKVRMNLSSEGFISAGGLEAGDEVLLPPNGWGIFVKKRP
jgi:1,4-alpha-glucan branching enzyme